MTPDFSCTVTFDRPGCARFGAPGLNSLNRSEARP